MTTSLQQSLRVASRVKYLTIRALLALLVVVEANRRLDLGVLAKQLKIPVPAVTRAVDALCINGFVKRVRNEEDARRIFIVTLQTGKQFVESLRDATQQHS